MTEAPAADPVQFHRCSASHPVPIGTPVQRAPWRTVDVHCHVFTPSVEPIVAELAEYAAHKSADDAAIGERSSAVNAGLIGTLAPRLVNIEARLADMDAMGVDVQVISPSPTQYHYWTSREMAQAVVNLQNDRIAQVCAAVPERFAGLGTVALQYPELAARQLATLVRDRGFKGVQISSLVNGTDIADPRFEPFWQACEDLGAIVFIHPWGTTLGSRLSDHYLMNTVGQPFETTICLSKLIFSGTLERHPRLRLIAAHGGGYLPAYTGRSDHAHAVRPEVDGCVCSPSSQLRNLWFDSLVFDPDQLATLVTRVGADRVMLGTDYPFDMGHYDPSGMVADLPQDQQRMILGANAAALFGL